MRFQRYVIAYDIRSTKRRNKVARLLKDRGMRVNLSVFECDIEKDKLMELRKEIQKIIKKKNDVVIYYPLCLNCHASVVSDGMVVDRHVNRQVVMI